MPADEIEREVLNYVGAVGAFRQVQYLAILVVFGFPVPAAGRVVGEELVKSPVARQLADLPPLAGLPGGITGLLHQFGHGLFVGPFAPGPPARHDWFISPPVRKA